MARIFHTSDLIGCPYEEFDEHLVRVSMSDPVYTLALTEPIGDTFMCASVVGEQIRFEIDAYEPVSNRIFGGFELIDTTTSPRTYLQERGRHVHGYGWYGKNSRRDKQFHGYRARGPMQSGYDQDGRRIERPHQANQWSFTCWKDNGRRYQAHGRVSEHVAKHMRWFDHGPGRFDQA